MRIKGEGSLILAFTKEQKMKQLLSGYNLFFSPMGLGLLIIFLLPRKKAKEAFPYCKKAGVLTAAERAFYLVLKESVDLEKYELLAQVRLADLVQVKPHTEKALNYFYKISAKSPDFVLCEKTTTTPLLVIELDDASHEETSRKVRDLFVDKVLAAAKLPILHVPCKRSYSKALLTQKIEEKLK